MNRVAWSDAAIADLHDIKAYLTDNYGPEFSQTNVETLIEAANWLLEYPFAGPALGYRQWRKWKPKRQRHILIYLPQKYGIEVVRVRHDRDDWKVVPD